MKIVSYNELLSLPIGTIFSYYRPCVCMGLHRKGESLPVDKKQLFPGDFWYSTIIAGSPRHEFGKPESPPDTLVVDDSEQRWGRLDTDQQFAVYEAADIGMLLKMLAGIIKDCT